MLGQFVLMGLVKNRGKKLEGNEKSVDKNKVEALGEKALDHNRENIFYFTFQLTNRELQARGYMVRFVVIAVMSEVMLALMLAVVYTHRQIF